MKINYKDEKIEIEEGKKVRDVFENVIKENKNRIVACIVNNKVKDLAYELKDGDEIDFIDLTSNDGKRVYQRGILYVMAKAFYETYPEVSLTVNYQIGNAMYCVTDNIEISEEMIKKVYTRMKEIINANLPIKKVIMSTEQAKEFYEKAKAKSGILQLNINKPTVSLYFCEEYYNYFYGVMPISTGVVDIFDIMKYQKGFLVRYPSRKEPNKLEVFEEKKKLLATLDEYENIYKLLNIDTLERLNECVKENRTKEVILLAEALHEKKLAEIANNISKNKQIKMVLIAGPSSSGKTTFAKRLGVELKLNGLKPVTISMDNYFVERDENPKDENGEYDFECIEAIDTNLLNSHLKALLQGKTIEMPTFNFKTGKKEYNGETICLGKDDILVIEGIHCLNDKLTFHIPREQKYKIYVSDLTVLNIDYYNRISTTDTRLIRRMVRDYNYRGISALRTLQSWEMVNRGENKNIFPYQEEADCMFNSSLVYEIAVLKKYAKPLLENISQDNKEYAEARRILDLLQYFEEIDDKWIPNNSLIREFIGESIFE